MSAVKILSLIIAFFALGLSVSSAKEGAHIVTFPRTIDPNCRSGEAKLFDECGSQLDVLNEAVNFGESEGKIVLVTYGAEWCIWCHVFDKYLAGETGKFKYSIEGEKFRLREYKNPDQANAAALRAYSADNFVLVHIENQYSPNGFDVLTATGAEAYFTGGIPYTYALKDGKFLTAIKDPSELEGLEVRRDTEDWYRGYNRELLLQELQRIKSEYESS